MALELLAFICQAIHLQIREFRKFFMILNVHTLVLDYLISFFINIQASRRLWIFKGIKKILKQQLG